MTLANSYSDVPAGKIAAIVTSLEMTRPPSREAPAGAWTIRHVARPDLAWYRDLYRRVGEPWLWFSRLAMDDTELAALIHDRAVNIHALEAAGRDEGLIELDFRAAGECELAFFGLTPALVGQGAGRFMMNEAIAQAWARPISRFWVHTCTLDHPGALDFYVRSGFRPFRRQVEIGDDPRATGALPRDSAPHIPLL